MRRTRYTCLGWDTTAGHCTARPMGTRRNPWLCDQCDRAREADLTAQMDRIGREMREEVRQR